MNRELLVTLLRKDIQELDMITEGFMEMIEYPKAIIQLAGRKADDIQNYIRLLGGDNVVIESEVEMATTAETIVKSVDQELVVEPEIYTTIHEFEAPIEFGAIEKIDEAEIVVSETIKHLVEIDNKAPLAEKSVNLIPSRNESLSKEQNSIGSLLANKKINDIKQAINIGDRFRFQRELFKGNGEDMNKTLHYINQLATLEEVQSFLQSKYNWNVESESVEDFYQIVRRRFL
ncbi:MAG: hypothetical protein PHR83_15570 [Paludibacter sp.]|nr:hypothetical protein [Paludibacter sp.]